MKRINFYISEKLKLNNSTEVEEKEYKLLTDKYDKGDKCLLLTDVGLRSQERILIDAVKITEKSKTILRYKFLTNICTDYSNHLICFSRMKSSDIYRINDYNYAFLSVNKFTEMLIPPQDCKEIFDLIEKNNYKLDFYETLHKNEFHKEKDYIKIKQLKEGKNKKNEFTFEDYEDITKDTFDKIKSAILD